MKWFMDARLSATLLLTLSVFFLQFWGLGDPLNAAKRELFDQLVRTRQNTTGGVAPPVVELTFDRDLRAEYWTRLMPGKSFAEWPAITPLAVVEGVMDAVKAGCAKAVAERGCPRLVVVDIDIWPVGTKRSDDEIGAFSKSLMAWSSDTHLPLIAFVRAPEWRNYRDERGQEQVGFELATAPPWDGLVRQAPNLTWAAGEALADNDGVARRFAYFTCVHSLKAKRIIPLPHAALFALAVWKNGTATTKKSVAGALAQECAGAAGNTTVPFELSGPNADTSSFKDRIGLIGYHLNDPEKAGASPTLLTKSGMPGAPAIQVVPARLLFETGAKLNFADGSILVLSSFQPSFEDVHWSPYGPMPGGLVLANSTRGLILDGPMQPLRTGTEFLILLFTGLAMHGYTFLMNRWHVRLLLRPGQAGNWKGGFLRVITSCEGAKYFAFVAVFVIGRFTGLWLAPYAMWVGIAIMGFVVVIYSVFNELNEAWSARNDSV